MTRTRTMANLLAATAQPRDMLAYRSAIGERASRIVTRCRPLAPVAHGFYQPAAFVEQCRAGGAREALYRDLCVQLAQKALLRGHYPPARGVTVADLTH